MTASETDRRISQLREAIKQNVMRIADARGTHRPSCTVDDLREMRAENIRYVQEIQRLESQQ